MGFSRMAAKQSSDSDKDLKTPCYHSHFTDHAVNDVVKRGRITKLTHDSKGEQTDF